jgi:calcineurin-like phosphoesterase family protein
MPKTFFISDTHFSHTNMLKFIKPNSGGEKLRVFNSIEEMNEAIIDNWNKVVSCRDTVYHLGDIAMKFQYVDLVKRLKGRKILLPGNHDRSAAKEYLNYFEDIIGVVKHKEFLLSHYPIHQDSIPTWCDANIHGHTHLELVRFNNEIDHRYFNVCVERINYTPIEIDEIRARIKERSFER